MRLKKASRFSINYLLLAFLLPLVGMLGLRLVYSIGYNGEFSMLYSDCYHQYYPFFKAFRSALLSGDSLLYSWDVGMGLDYLGLYAYYLASPLNLLSVLVPEGWTMGYFSLLMPLKLGFAGLFFALFLKKTFGRDDLTISLFGGFYALCAWSLGYQWNIMWLDSFALLPLVMLGMVRLLKERKFMLYTFSLFLAIYANYYIGFFVCIFVLLCFICYQICRWQGFKKLLIDLCLMALFSLLAIGMTAIISLPALSALQSTQSSINKFPDTFRLNIANEHSWRGLLDAMRQVAGNMNGGIEVTYKQGLPNLYCGIGTNLLALLFLTCKEVRLRDKICSVGLLLFFNISFIIRQLDYIWHGFHFTNMIPYRFSFLYSFVLLYMAYRAWLNRRSFRPWQVILSGLLALGLVFCSEEIEPFIKLISGQEHMDVWTNWNCILGNLETILNCSTYFSYNLLFLLGFCAALLYGYRPRLPDAQLERKDWLSAIQDKRSATRIALHGVMALELVLILVLFGAQYPATNTINYPMGREDTEKVIDYMHNAEENTLFYRAETTHSQTLNDGALNGYHGISTFTSSANVKVTEFMQALGYGAKNTYNRYCFEESSPVSNLFLNLKYMIERKNEPQNNAYFDTVCNSGSTWLLKNNAYLPLGFLTDVQILNVDWTNSDDPFMLQNELMQKATGTTQDFWTFLSDHQVTIHGHDLTLSAQNRTGYCSYETDTVSGSIAYRYVPNSSGLFCFYVNQTKNNKFTVFYNGEEVYSETYSLPQLLSVCDVQPGDEIKIEFSCTSAQSGTINVTAAVLDEEVFRSGYEILAATPLELTKFQNTVIEGTVICDSDGVLYTSIPQDGNWTATVDGEPAQIVLIGNVMVGLNLAAGEHTVAFRYQNPAFSLGWKVSLGCFLTLLLIWYWLYAPQLPWRKKGKFEKK